MMMNISFALPFRLIPLSTREPWMFRCFSTRRFSATYVARSLLPDQSDFQEYAELDLPTEGKVQSIKNSGIGGPKDEWIASEKVHGTNFGMYLLNDGKVYRYSKRSGIMHESEDFFGYHSILPELQRIMKTIRELLMEKYQMTSVDTVICNGEMFGGLYKHPKVPKNETPYLIGTRKCFIEPIQEEPFPQYSPNIHFFAFDLKFMREPAAKAPPGTTPQRAYETLTFDECTEIFSKVPGMIYAKPIIRGTLDQILAFDVENFVTPLPALLGWGNFPLENNFAEGLVARFSKRGKPQYWDPKYSTILKIRNSAFMEVKHPKKQRELIDTFLNTVRANALKSAGIQSADARALLPEVEAAANELLMNHVSEGRLSNVMSKHGKEGIRSGTMTQLDVANLLAKDALKDFLKTADAGLVGTPVSFRKTLVENCFVASKTLVEKQWKRLVGEH